MITRDNAQSVKGNARNARERLGQLIEHYMNERDCDDRRVARTCSASPADVERWRRGELVPSPEQWAKLKRSVNHAFGRFADVYQRARAEDEQEARERAAKSVQERPPVPPMRPDTKINTALGDKLAAATAPEPEPEPAPIVQLQVVRDDPAGRKNRPTASEQLGIPVRGEAADGRKLMPMRPAGSFSEEAQQRRRAFVRELLIQRPRIRTSGADSVLEAVRKAFGIGISPDTVDEIRAELERERIKAEIMRDLPPPQPPTLPAMAAQLAEHVTASAPVVPPPAPAQATADHEADINTAVGLILESIPNLQTFTITVDEHGEASVDYQIRKVKIETVGGSFKVKR